MLDGETAVWIGAAVLVAASAFAVAFLAVRKWRTRRSADLADRAKVVTWSNAGRVTLDSPLRSPATTESPNAREFNSFVCINLNSRQEHPAEKIDHKLKSLLKRKPQSAPAPENKSARARPVFVPSAWTIVFGATAQHGAGPRRVSYSSFESDIETDRLISRQDERSCMTAAPTADQTLYQRTEQVA